MIGWDASNSVALFIYDKMNGPAIERDTETIMVSSFTFPNIFVFYLCMYDMVKNAKISHFLVLKKIDEKVLSK